MKKSRIIIWFLFVSCGSGLTIIMATSCPSHWKDTPYGCFLPTTSFLTYEGAKTYCKGLSAHLITAVRNLSLDRQNLFQNLLGVGNTDNFIGLRKTSKGSYWEDGVKADAALEAKLSTDASRPCALIRTYGSYEINAASCTASCKSICEKKISGTSVLSTLTVTTSLEPSWAVVPTPPPTPQSTSSISPSSSSSSSSSLSSSSSSSSSSTSSIATSISFVPFSQSYSPTPDLLSSSSSSSSSFSTSVELSSVPLSTTLGSSSSLSLPTSENQKWRERNGSQSLDKNMVSLYIQNITKLEVRQRSSLNESVDMMQNMLVAMETSTYISAHQILLFASQILEEFALSYMEYHLNEKEIMIKRNNVVLQATIVGLPQTNDYLFETNDGAQQETMILLPKENFIENETSVVSIYYSNLADIMNKQEYKFRSNRYKVRSKILSTSIQPNKNKLVKNATIGFKISVSDPRLERKCVFWEFATEKVKDPGWSSEGCTLVKSTDQYVECSCNHLTHFAVLMQVKDDQIPHDHDVVLTMLTKIGLGLSIVGCILTFLAYWRFTDVKSEQSQIRMNLVFVLAVAHTLFLVGSAAKSNIILCISVAALLQLFYTSALCWMFAEGIQLYMQVVKVFNTNLKMRQVYGFAWGLPSILTIASLSIAGNGPGGLSSFVNEEFCWLSTKNNLMWTFIGPVLLLILFNHVILAMVVKEIIKINIQDITTEQTTVLRSSVRALIILAPLLGITWVVGLLCIFEAGTVGLYIFTILNSFQGIFIFIFHCLRNSEIQKKIRRRMESSDGPFRSNQIKPNQTNATCKQGKTLQTPHQNMMLSEFHHSDFQESK